MRNRLFLSALLTVGAWAAAAAPVELSGAAGTGMAGAPMSAKVWTPYPAADPFVWAADACLGFFITRELAALGGGTVTTQDEHGLEVELGAPEARIHLDDSPPDGGGAFRCNSMRWPELEPSPDRLEAIGLWIGERLRSREGWVGGFEPDNPHGRRTRTIADYRNEALGVRIRVEARHDYPTRRDYLTVSLEADQPGPPAKIR